MILPLLIVVPSVLVGIGLYVVLSRTNVMPTMVGSGDRPSTHQRFESEYPEDGLWPVRQVQRIPQGILIALVAVMAVWVLVWVVAFFVGLGMLSI